MDALYSNHVLAYDHLCQTSQVAAALLPAVEDCGLQTAVMRCFNRMERFLEKHPDHRLMEIAEELPKAFTEVRLAAGRST